MHYFRYICTLSKARETTTEFVFLPFTFIFGCLDIHGYRSVSNDINHLYLISCVFILLFFLISKLETAYLGVSVLLFILARFTPYEWPSPSGQHVIIIISILILFVIR